MQQQYSLCSYFAVCLMQQSPEQGWPNKPDAEVQVCQSVCCTLPVPVCAAGAVSPISALYTACPSIFYCMCLLEHLLRHTCWLMEYISSCGGGGGGGVAWLRAAASCFAAERAFPVLPVLLTLQVVTIQL